MLMPFEGEEEAVRLANMVDYGAGRHLDAGYRQGARESPIRCRQARSGLTATNMIPPHAPYGGYKLSGFGRVSGLHCLLDLYTQVKNVHIDISPDYFEWFG